MMAGDQRVPREASPRGARYPGLHAASGLFAALLGALVLLVAAILTWSALELVRATHSMTRDTERMSAAHELETLLLTHQRLANLYAATREARLDLVCTEMEAQMRSLLASRHEPIAAEREAQAEARDALEEYFHARNELERSRTSVEQTIPRIRPFVDRAVAGTERLRHINRDQVHTAQRDVARAVRASALGGGGAALLLTLSTLALLLAVRRRLVAPLSDLHAAILRLRRGEPDARADGAGLRETRELACAFNEMSGALSRQHEGRLAFVAGIVHELRNPLSVLALGLQAVAETDDPAERAELAEPTMAQIARLERLLDDLLDTARVEAGHVRLELERVDLRDVASTVLGLYGSSSPRHECILDLPDDPVMAACDPARIEQVLGNLVTNAIKYSPHGGRVRVKVGTAGGDAVLEVSDAGIGIAPGDLQEIFAPFQRMATAVAKGAGLGLSVVRRIVVAHGGSIEVESVVERGTTFRIRLACA